MPRLLRSEWLVVAGLIALSLIPALFGTLRLVELASGAETTASNARFFATPIPVVMHILAAVPYCIIGAFQFAPSFRRRHRRWHRAVGRVLAPLGLTAAAAGLWMAHFYPWPPNDGELLYALRLLFGSWMFGAILIALVAVRRRDFKSHGNWMMRGYAIGLGAGTQVLTHIPWVALYGQPGELARGVLMGAGWAINLAAAEWVIRRRRVVPPGLAQPAGIRTSPGRAALPRKAVAPLP